MAHETGTGPAYATVTVFEQSTNRLATLYRDVGLTVPLANPFPCVAGVYDFYTAVAVYVVFGFGMPIYEETESMTFREYQGPYNFP